jgi:hypothetical protein
MNIYVLLQRVFSTTCLLKVYHSHIPRSCILIQIMFLILLNFFHGLHPMPMWHVTNWNSFFSKIIIFWQTCYGIMVVVYNLIPKGPETIFKPFLKFGQAIVKAIFIKNSWIKLWTCGLVLASRRTNFYKIPIFGLVLMSQNTFFFSKRAA